jgi:stearoyl-CoA desaturase (delta-9 desaturase)
VIVLTIVFYYLTLFGVTVGYHRMATHESFKVKPWLRVILLIFGTMAFEGQVTRWVTDHRVHHMYDDREGDPHSPLKYGSTPWGMIKGLGWAHVGWLFDKDHLSREKYAPDLLADPYVMWVDKTMPVWVAVSVLLPGAITGLVGWSWHDVFLGFFWATLVRICVMHHATFGTNSVAHVFGRHPFKTRDNSRNIWMFWPITGGEWFHNGHHAFPRSFRHGLLPGQIDLSAIIIWSLEKVGLAKDVVRVSKEAQAKKLA